MPCKTMAKVLHRSNTTSKRSNNYRTIKIAYGNALGKLSMKLAYENKLRGHLQYISSRYGISADDRVLHCRNKERKNTKILFFERTYISKP